MSFSPTRYEVRHLEALVAVAEEGTFRGAADLLGYSQAAISQQIAALEADVGSPVFDRPGGPRAVTLTPVGRALLRHARAILDRLDQAREEVHDVLAGTGGRLIVGTFQSVSVELVPQIVGRMRATHPDLLMRAVERDDNEDLLTLLRDGEIDVTFLAGPVYDPSVDVIELGTDPFRAVLPRTFAGRTSASLGEVVGLGLIGEQGGSSQAHIEEGMRAHGVSPRYVFRTNDNGAMQAMVRNGLGAAIMPQLAIQLSDPEVLVLPTDPPIPRRSIVLAMPKPGMRAPAVEAFAEIVQKVCSQRLDPPEGVTVGAARRDGRAAPVGHTR
ncbi:MAG: LysR family transcriptional regulator [Candidatus Nanopelagicales bacterium]